MNLLKPVVHKNRNLEPLDLSNYRPSPWMEKILKELCSEEKVELFTNYLHSKEVCDQYPSAKNLTKEDFKLMMKYVLAGVDYAAAKFGTNQTKPNQTILSLEALLLITKEVI